ncbi:MAG TPA: Wadjet anti-phage system protein JetD domain-containing protein [Ktedonobacteraceae bacterium]
MISPAEIRLRAERLYLTFLQSWLRAETFQPLSWPAGRVSENLLTARNEVQQLLAAEKKTASLGYRVESRVQQTRALGTQTLPVRIWLDSPADFLHLIEKEQEFASFCQDVALMRASLPQLANWVEHSPRKLLDWHADWEKLLLVCRYFLEHPRPDLYIRELPINVHTKFIEQHQGILRDLLDHLLPPTAMRLDAPTFQQRYGLREEESMARVRFLADQLRQRYDLPFDDLSVPCSQLAATDFSGQTCIITENKLTFLTLPRIPGAFAILGGGFQVSNLANVPWLACCPIIYWGDLDAQGFQILSQLRSIFPHVTSLMMDTATLHAFAEFRVPGTPCRARQLPYLTDEEHSLFVQLAAETSRLEQERISQAYALAKLQECLLT